jgi:hypothetical protein
VRQALYELRVEGYLIREKGRAHLSEDLPSNYVLSDNASMCSLIELTIGMWACDKSPTLIEAG